MSDVRAKYGSLEVLKGISFSIEKGENTYELDVDAKLVGGHSVLQKFKRGQSVELTYDIELADDHPDLTLEEKYQLLKEAHEKVGEKSSEIIHGHTGTKPYFESSRAGVKWIVWYSKNDYEKAQVAKNDHVKAQEIV